MDQLFDLYVSKKIDIRNQSPRLGAKRDGKRAAALREAIFRLNCEETAVVFLAKDVFFFYVFYEV